MEVRSIPVRIGEVVLYDKQLILVKLIDNHEITLEDVKEQIDCAMKLSDGKDFVVVLDGGLTLDVADGAMRYTAHFKNEKWKAFAIVVRSLSERLFANYYLMFKKPVRPTKVFTTPAGAEKWLRQFVNIERALIYDI